MKGNEMHQNMQFNYYLFDTYCIFCCNSFTVESHFNSHFAFSSSVRDLLVMR